jgi:hypothetical protein
MNWTVLESQSRALLTNADDEDLADLLSCVHGIEPARHHFDGFAAGSGESEQETLKTVERQNNRQRNRDTPGILPVGVKCSSRPVVRAGRRFVQGTGCRSPAQNLSRPLGCRTGAFKSRGSQQSVYCVGPDTFSTRTTVHFTCFPAAVFNLLSSPSTSYFTSLPTTKSIAFTEVFGLVRQV